MNNNNAESRAERARKLAENKSNVQDKEPPKSSTPKTTQTKRPTKLEGQLKDFFAGVALTVTLTGDDFSAGVIAARGDELASAWAELAKQNASVHRVLSTLVEGSAWANATMVTMSVAIPIAWHHNLVPDSIGVPFTKMVTGIPESDEVRSHKVNASEVTPKRADGAQKRSDNVRKPGEAAKKNADSGK